MNKGFVLSMEAIISLIFLLLLMLAIFSLIIQTNSSLDILLLQKENDLLKLWAIEAKFNQEEMISDIKFFFPKKQVLFKFNKKTLIKGQGNEAVSSEIKFLNEFNKPIELNLTIFKN